MRQGLPRSIAPRTSSIAYPRGDIRCVFASTGEAHKGGEDHDEHGSHVGEIPSIAHNLLYHFSDTL
jgi:hypothetical protein